jgi:hypothetical protein
LLSRQLLVVEAGLLLLQANRSSSSRSCARVKPQQGAVAGAWGNLLSLPPPPPLLLLQLAVLLLVSNS